MLTKSAEGLKQSGFNWLKEVERILTGIGFTRCHQDPKLYKLLHDFDDIITLLVQIDDFYGSALRRNTISWLFDTLQRKSTPILKNLGELSYGYGINFTWNEDRSERSMDQHRYLDHLLVRFNAQDGKQRFETAPNMKPEEIINSDDLCSSGDSSLYRSITGSTLFLLRITRPDIAHAQLTLNRCMSRVTKPALRAAYWLLDYLRTTRHYKLTYSKKPRHKRLVAMGLTGPRSKYKSTALAEFTDSNYAIDKSTSSCWTLLANSVVKQYVRLQKNTSLSSTQAEIYATLEGWKDVKFTRNIIAFMTCRDVEDIPATPFFIDSKSARNHTEIPKYSAAMKHLANADYAARDALERGEIMALPISGLENPADIGTKYLGRVATEAHAQMLLNLSDDEVASVYWKAKADAARKVANQNRSEFKSKTGG